jgi:NAD(P)-dependent dehydrogenase (short-subunit alcohol dehydrogenase family)
VPKKVLITGASRGLGYALLEEYASRGFYVIACARDPGSAKLRGMGRELKERVLPLAMDVGSSESVARAAAEAGRGLDAIDIIVNNAGLHAVDSSAELEKVDVDNCLGTYNVNTVGALRVVKAFLPLLERGELKTIVNISSDAARIAESEKTAEFDYCMSKAALNMQTRLLQNYLGPRGVRVLAIHPGWMRTDMGGPTATNDPRDSAREVASVVEKYRNIPRGPVFIDQTGRPLGF